jgi:hypothetical protein
MQDHEKKYGWTVSLYEYESTIPTLWEKTKGARALVLSCPPDVLADELGSCTATPSGRVYQDEPGLLGGTEHEGVDRSRRWRDVQPLSLLVRSTRAS